MNVSDLNTIADRTDRDRSEIRTRIPRVAIVGTGFVGATTAYALLMSETPAEIVLIDRDRRRAEGHAMKRNAEILYFESDPKIFEDRFARCRHLLHFLAVRILGSEDEAEHAVRNSRAAASRNPPGCEMKT
jgi:glycine/D-amino acid oxidase-like deaminating enzyme